MGGAKVVVPSKHQSSILDELHVGHMGVVKMKGLARSHVWWPTIDKDIEGVTRACSGRQLMRNDPKLTPVHPWEYPEGPWYRIHIDFAGPIEGKKFMVVVDAYSEVIIMPNTTTQTTIEKLHDVFAR